MIDKYTCERCGYHPVWEIFMSTYVAYYCPRCGHVRYERY